MTLASVLNPPSQAYLVWHRFSMPTKDGSKDAIAVEAKVADELLAAYTFMLEHIVIYIWGITVVFVLFICIRFYDLANPNNQIHSEIHKKKHSPLAALEAAVRHIFRRRSSSRTLAVLAWVALWLVVTLGFVVAKYTIPIIFARYIKIANAAPVNPDAIFVPYTSSSNNENEILQSYTISVPSALRAIGSVNGNMSTKHPVSVDNYEVLPDDHGRQVIRMGYRYQVTGLDFGLQFYPGLVLNVEGSCITEYGWMGDNVTDSSNPGTLFESYFPFNNAGQEQIVSLFDGGPPMAYFFDEQQTVTNWSWAAIISSADRTSRWAGTDAWYLTDNSSDANGNFFVQPERPALSCWQNDVWSYGAYNSSVTGLNSTFLPGLDLSLGLQNIIAHFLGQPMIYTLGSLLRESSLASSSTAFSGIFNASSSSIHDDLERLVYASYIATANILTETTLFINDNGTLNDLKVGNYAQDGPGEFVVFTSDVVALSVRSLIIIPTLTVTLWITFLVLWIVPGKAIDKKFKASHKETSDKISQQPGGEAGVHHQVEQNEEEQNEAEEKGKEEEEKRKKEEENHEDFVGKIVDYAGSLFGGDKGSTANSITEV